MKLRIVAIFCIAIIALAGAGCSATPPAESRSGVDMASAPDMVVGSDGLTNEQRNISKRLVQESDPLAIKYLYAVSPFTGDIIYYSSIVGKPTSSGKRLTPTTVEVVYPIYNFKNGVVGEGTTSGFVVPWGERGAVMTKEAPQDDGTFGSSIEYLYWYDARGIYHQQYLVGLAVHISSQPIGTKKAVFNFEEMEPEYKKVNESYLETPAK